MDAAMKQTSTSPAAPGEQMRARPGLKRYVSSIAIHVLAALVLTATISMGVDALYPSFLTEDHAANRLRMARLFVPLALTFVWIQLRAFKYMRAEMVQGRLTLYHPQPFVLSFDEIERIRVGAPPPKVARRATRANEFIGKVSALNRNAAQYVRDSYANTIVVDRASDIIVINLTSAEGGVALLREFLRQNAEHVQPSEFSEAERRRFGRFVPGLYTKVGHS